MSPTQVEYPQELNVLAGINLDGSSNKEGDYSYYNAGDFSKFLSQHTALRFGRKQGHEAVARNHKRIRQLARQILRRYKKNAIKGRHYAPRVALTLKMFGPMHFPEYLRVERVTVKDKISKKFTGGWCTSRRAYLDFALLMLVLFDIYLFTGEVCSTIDQVCCALAIILWLYDPRITFTHRFAWTSPAFDRRCTEKPSITLDPVPLFSFHHPVVAPPVEQPVLRERLELTRFILQPYQISKEEQQRFFNRILKHSYFPNELVDIVEIARQAYTAGLVASEIASAQLQNTP